MKHIRHIVMLLTLLGASTTLKAIDFTEGEFNYITCGNGDEVELTGYTGSDSHVVIPSYASYENVQYPVVSIGEDAFKERTDLTSIEIPPSVTEIKPFAFNSCTSLTSIEIPSSVTEIGYGAFMLCTRLTFIEIPSSVTKIGSAAFDSCTNLSSITIPSSVTVIADRLFNGCMALTNIDIPSSVTEIGHSAFYYCTRLISLNIPTSVTKIGGNAFSHCTSLTSIEIPASVNDLGYCLFDESGIKTVKIMGTPKFYDIGNSFYYTFYGYEGDVVCQGSFIPVVKKYYDKVYGFDIPFNIRQMYDGTDRISGFLIGCENNPYYEMDKVDISRYKLLVYEGIDGIDETRQVYSSPLRCPETVAVTGLKWNSDYTVTFGHVAEGADLEINQYTPLKISTSSPEVVLQHAWPDQTSVKVTVKAGKYDPEMPENVRVKLGYDEYLCDKDGVVKISNLHPGLEYGITAYADYDGTTISSKHKSFSTKKLIADVRVSSEDRTPTTARLVGNVAEGDAVIMECGFKGVGTGDKLLVTGLIPNTDYTHTFYVITDRGIEETMAVSFRTPELKLSMLDPRCVSERCAIVAAETNLPDTETTAGFQWKKYDAPEALKPSEAYAAIYGGQLEGYIKNLQPTYYNVRAFFENAAGKRTYTEWITFDPTDFSFFEPTVHTYPVETVSNNEVMVRGYALAGTDPIISQGFQYWKAAGSAESRIKAPSADKIFTVEATGQMMTASITGLNPGTEYVLRSFVETAAGYTYGEEQSFTTTGSAGVDDIEEDVTAAEIVGYYDLTGRRYDTPQKGFNIVVYSDGTSRKEFVK